MSSDTFHIKLTRRGLDVELSCTTGTAAGVNDHAVTRSFVLLALAGGAGDDSPLGQALAKLDFNQRAVDEAFYREHVEKFIAWTRLVRRDDICDESGRRAFIDQLTRQNAPDLDAQVERKYPRHRFVLQARLTDVRWAEGVPDAFGTTSFDVWTDDPEFNPPAFDAGVATDGPQGRTVKFPNVALSELGGSSDGKRVFVWMRHVTSLFMTSSPHPFSWSPHPGGMLVALDAQTLAVQSHLALGPLLRRDGHRVEHLQLVRVSPEGDAVLLVLRPGPAVQYGLGARAGQALGVFQPKGTQGMATFSDARWDEAGRDFVLVGGGEVSDSHGRLAWPTVLATAAALDDARVAAIGDKALATWDRAKKQEAMRAEVVKPTEVVLLPEGQVALLASGGSSRAKIQVFQADGTELASVNARWGANLRASPSGLLAVRSMDLTVYDPVTARVVALEGVNASDHVWLGDERLAAVHEGELTVVDVAAALEKGKVKKVKVATPATKAAAAAAPPKPPPPDIKQRVDAAIEALRARRGPLGFSRASGKFMAFMRKGLPAHVVALLDGCIEVEVGWCDAGVPKFRRYQDARPSAVRDAKPGEHHFCLKGEGLSPYRRLDLGAADLAALQVTLDGKTLSGKAFSDAWLPFVFYDGRWVALSPDGLRVATGTRDMRTWKTDPRTLEVVVDDALKWLRDVA